MGLKTFSGINGRVGTVEVNSDYEQAEKYDKVRVGKLGVFFRDGLRIRFMAYGLLERVFIRVNEVNIKTC